MTEFSCPACGAPVPFRSKLSVFGVCPFCSQMLVRRDIDVEAIGKMAMLPEDSSPLQVGTSGKFEGRQFTLLGRLRQEWADGNWNEWFAIFDDGSQGWLGEAQGFLMMSFDKTSGTKIPASGSLNPGQKIQIGEIYFEIEDIKPVVCAGSQGELPFTGQQGRKSISVDLTGPGKTFACLDYSSDGTHAYIGKYVDFSELALQNLRQIDGW